MSEYARRIGAQIQQMDQLNRQLRDTSFTPPPTPEIHRPDVIQQIEAIFEDVQDNLPLVSDASLQRVYRSNNYYRWLPGGAVVLEWGEKLEPTDEELEILREYGQATPGMSRPDFLPDEIITFDGQRILGGIKASNFPGPQIVQFLSDVGSGSFISTLEKNGMSTKLIRICYFQILPGFLKERMYWYNLKGRGKVFPNRQGTLINLKTKASPLHFYLQI